MSQVYSECTVCFRPLTPSEVKLNQEKENYYYTVCEECLERYTNKLIKIVSED